MSRTLLSLMLLAFAVPAFGADFSKEGVAFLQKHCYSCHGAEKKRGEITFHTFKDDASLIKERKLFDSVARVVASGEMPPKDKPRPSVEEYDTFLKVVKTVYDKHDATAKPDPGRVTIRRLNKVEYSNTVRDLLGVDFNPTEDFPSDDIGYGFDNIGDVLSVSPVLMERYLNAAEAVAQRVIASPLPKPSDRWQGGKYLEPGGNWPDKKFRLAEKGFLNTPYKLGLSGDYVFKFKAYGTFTGDEPLKVSIKVDDKEVAKEEIKVTDEKNAKVYEYKLKIDRGDRRIWVTVLNPGKKEDKTERTLHVEWFHLHGPSDTRPQTHRDFTQADTTKPKAEQTKELLTRFLNRAFRRPATTEEVTRLVKLVDAAQTKGESYEGALQLAIQATLVSPKFLFRVELDNRPAGPEPKPLDEYQLASRLSYFIWASMPDDELFKLASEGKLSANLEPQVKRMLKDPKAKSLVDNFVMQWLQLKRLSSFTPDAKMFPKFDERLKQAMLTETEMFFSELIREDRSILDIIDGKYTYLNSSLAGHYGIADTKGNLWSTPAKEKRPGGTQIPWDKFVRVELPDNGPRGGILTQASILTVTSNPTRTSPVKRGKWVLEQVLGTPPPPPPPDVPELEAKEGMKPLTLRKQMEVHRENVACANCHAKMDPLGFAFENYDAVGAYRWKDGQDDIDASGELPGGVKFKGSTELKKILKDKQDQVARGVSEKLLIYALGRGLEYYDKRSLDGIVTATARGDYKFSSLVLGIVQSDPFRKRRGTTGE